MNFLAETNVAGQTLLRLVSRGNAIIAELLRLSDHIPAVFKFQDKVLVKKYENILCDFKYLKSTEFFEHRIQNSADLLELDEEFKENHIEILKRFYQLFESIYKFVKDFIQYLEDLEEGRYIQHTFEGILLNGDGKQLVSEALYLYGVMLLLLDELFEGAVRERMLISYLRYKGHQEEPLLYEVCELCKNTGYQRGTKKPLNYPEEYFARIPISKTAISMIIGRLRSDDIYNQITAYPLPEHRSAALANQSSMLYVILYFSPETLQAQNAIMREIVDKHFPDNWVISYYLGFVVDLSIVWDNYRAAKAALSNTIQIPNVTRLKQLYWGKVDQVLKLLHQYLTEGILVEEFILENINKLLACLREANVTIRWLLLHSNAEDKKLRTITGHTQDQDYDKVLLLILSTAQFEFVLKNCIQAILSSKQAKWENLRKECSDRMTELGEYFSGEKALTRVRRNETLMKWFQDISKQITGLDYSDSILAGRKIHQLVQALEQVEEFHQIESSLQVKQFLIDTRSFLNQMLRIVNVKEEILVVIALVSDISYAWEIINDYVRYMQDRIERDPSSVLKLRATFLKLASILQLPLVRISQAASADLYSVSEYYSGELVAFVRKVLECVPRSMFRTLAQIIDIQTNKMKELQTKVEKDSLVDFAQLDQRYDLAKATHDISLFTEGILAMETTLVGVVKVEPHQLLEDGIRKELVRHIATALDTELQFKFGKMEEFSAKLSKLASKLDGIKRSFQYIQDYINIYGLKVWQEEFSRITNYNVEQECNSFLKKKVFDWESIYQSDAIPIPTFPPVDEHSVDFIGRLARELVHITDCKKTIYIEPMSAWYDLEGRELVGIRTFDLLLKSVDVFGISGLDKLYCFMMVKELQVFVAQLRRELQSKELKEFVASLVAQLSPTTTIPTGTQKLYAAAVTRTAKLWTLFLDTTTSIGQMQLLRRQIANTLNFSCKLDSNLLYSTLNVANKALIKDIQEHYLRPDTKPYPSEDNPLLSELTKYLDNAGINDPYTKIYITTEPIENLACLMFLFVLSQAPKFQFNEQLSIMLHRKDKRSFDGTSFVIGIITLLKQFHISNTHLFLAYLGQFVRAYVNIALQREAKLADLPEEALSVLLFLEQYLKLSNLDPKLIESYLPAYIINNFKH